MHLATREFANVEIFVCLLVLLSSAAAQSPTVSLTANPTAIDFGRVNVGTQNKQTETVTNGGASIVTISSIVAGENGDFTVPAVPLPITLRPGQSTSFNVFFSPVQVTALLRTNIRITSDALTSNLDIPVSGEAPKGNLWPQHNSIIFPFAQVNTTLTMEGTLVNNGGTPVTIQTATTDRPEFLSNIENGTTLDPGQRLNFSVQFFPKKAGKVEGALRIQSDGANPVLVMLLSGSSTNVRSLPGCSLAKVNVSCKLLIDRSNPVSPPTLQLYSNQKVTVIVKNPNRYERYFLDYQSGQATVLPDVGTSIVQGLLPSLAKVQISSGRLSGVLPTANDSCSRSDVTRLPLSGNVSGVVPAFQDCVTQITARAVDIYRDLEQYVSPDSLTPVGFAPWVDPIGVQQDIARFLASEFLVSSKISVIASDPILKVSSQDAPAIQQLTNLQKFIDGIASDLMGYSQRLADLQGFNNGAQPCENLVDISPKERADHTSCLFITSTPDDDRIYANMVTRTLTYAVNSLNMVSYARETAPDSTKKKLLVSIPVNFADNPTKAVSSLRWEPSAGVFFSSLAIRSFSVTPVFTNGTITDHRVSESILRPTVVPFAAANYRISNDLRWTRWKSSFYLTGGLGINPNTLSADVAAGISLSWRSLMFSPLWHYGHDTRLTQGLHTGESLGASFSGNVTTQSYWTNCFAFGISIRVPSIAGR